MSVRVRTRMISSSSVPVLASTWPWAGDVSENHAHREGTAVTVSIDQRRRPQRRRSGTQQEPTDEHPTHATNDEERDGRKNEFSLLI